MAGIQGHAVAEAPTGVARALLYVHSQGLSLLSSSSINQPFLSHFGSIPTTAPENDVVEPSSRKTEVDRQST